MLKELMLGEYGVEKLLTVESCVYTMDAGRLPMHDKLDYLEDRRCTFCELIEETQKHLFFIC